MICPVESGFGWSAGHAIICMPIKLQKLNHPTNEEAECRAEYNSGSKLGGVCEPFSPATARLSSCSGPVRWTSKACRSIPTATRGRKGLANAATPRALPRKPRQASAVLPPKWSTSIWRARNLLGGAEVLYLQPVTPEVPLGQNQLLEAFFCGGRLISSLTDSNFL